MFNQPLKDSGNRRNFATGAVRDVARGKGRMDLMPPDALIALSKHFEKGAEKYAERNWEKGIPYSKYLDSGIRHALQALNDETDEPHVIAACWNFLCLAQTMIWVDKGILPSTLNDLPLRIADDRDPEDIDAEQALQDATDEAATRAVKAIPVPISADSADSREFQEAINNSVDAMRASTVAAPATVHTYLFRNLRYKKGGAMYVKFVGEQGYFAHPLGSSSFHIQPMGFDLHAYLNNVKEWELVAPESYPLAFRPGPVQHLFMVDAIGNFVDITEEVPAPPEDFSLNFETLLDEYVTDDE